MAKLIEIKDGSLECKIRVIGSVFVGEMSEMEIRVLAQIVSSAENGQLYTHADGHKTISKALSLNPNTLSVSIHRLVKKGAINKSNGVITIPPFLTTLNSQNEFLIRFTDSPMLKANESVIG